MIHSRWYQGDLIFYDGTQDIMTIKDDTDGIIFGESGEGVDVKIYGETTGAYFLFDESADLVDFHNIKITYQEPNTVGATGTIVTTTLTSTSNRFQFVDTSGATNVLLPTASGEEAVGIQFFIANTSTDTLTVYSGTSSGGSVVGIIDQYETGILVNDGHVWKGIVATATG